MSPVIDADARQAVACVPRSCTPVIDADARQTQISEIKPHPCEEVIIA